MYSVWESDAALVHRGGSGAEGLLEVRAARVNPAPGMFVVEVRAA